MTRDDGLFFFSDLIFSLLDVGSDLKFRISEWSPHTLVVISMIEGAKPKSLIDYEFSTEDEEKPA